MQNLRNGLIALAMVVICYAAATFTVCYVAPQSALADQLGALTIAGKLTVVGDIHCTTDIDCDTDLTVDGDADVGTDFTVAGNTTHTGTTTLTGAVTSAAGITGDLIGDVTGDLTGKAITEVTYKGNLASAKADIGALDSRMYRNAVGDTGWMATKNDSTWVQMWP